MSAGEFRCNIIVGWLTEHVLEADVSMNDASLGETLMY
jgi:hypothetical protein